MQRIVTGIILTIALVAPTALTAQAQYYGNYGDGNVPQGSYQQSCSNEHMRGDRLVAYCTNGYGQRVRSTLDVNGCRGDIANLNGRLSCRERFHQRPNGNAYGYDNNRVGYNDYGVPTGGYQQTCNNERMSGSVLFATCEAVNGQWVNTSLDLRRCQNNAIYNNNGYLGC